jgi:phenylalanyl-tRNA synthetase beta chain
VAEPTKVSFVCGRDFAAVKGIVESLVERIAPSAVLSAEPIAADVFSSGRGARLKLNDVDFGWIGELDRSVTDALDLQDAASIAELDTHVLEELHEVSRTYKPLPRFPSVSRDLNFVLPEDVSWARLSSVAKEAGGDLLSEVSFGGQYRGKQIDAGHKSYVVTCRFMAADRTLTADEVDQAVEQILQVCKQSLDARLR